jgi:hypothetical protein
MLSPLAVGLVVCVLVGMAIVVALTVRAERADGTIARVLYEAENPDQRRR